jgi:tRNA threonylcarbamoyladenosine biosynthesis protein TsaB
MHPPNPTILAVDTCSGSSSIALAHGDSGSFELLGRVELSAEWTSTALHVEIAGLLARHQLGSADISSYAVTNGPGSFTAVRIGTTAVKGLAEVHRKPVVAVSTLALIAYAAASSAQESSAETVWVPILDARRAQVFSGIYCWKDGSVELLEPETVSSFRSVLERCRELGKVPVKICNPDMSIYADAIAASEMASAEAISVPAELAGVLAGLGLRTILQGDGLDPIAVDANYIRASDAELFWKG